MVHCGWYFCHSSSERPEFRYLEKIIMSNIYIKAHTYMMPPKPITYNTDLERLLKEHSEECESLSILHRMSYEKYNKRSNYINIPVIILSSAIGFITGIDLQYAQMNIILGVGSVFVGIIKSVDTYFQLAKRAESHRICSLQFSQISKKLQVELTLHRDQRLTAENMMNIVKTDIKNMQDIAPLIDDDIIEVYNAKYRKYKRVKKPNFVNGLTEVKVNPHNNEHEYEYASRQGSRQGSRDASPSNNQNDQTASSQDPPPPPPPETFSSLDHAQQQEEEDNASVDPVQPTIISNTNNIMNQMSNQIIRKSPSLSSPIPIQAPIPLSVPVQNPVSLPVLDNSQLLQLYQQLQAQAQAQAQAPGQARVQTPAPAQSQANSPSPASTFIAVPPAASHSPANSIRSNSSVPLGQIQTDSSGNLIINT